MAPDAIYRLSPDDLGDLIALEKAAFVPHDRQSERSLRYLLTRANAQLWGVRSGTSLDAVAVVLYRRDSRAARLYSIATLQTSRRRGLAGKLLQHAEQSARLAKCERMRAEVRESNLASQKLFTGAGYRCFGRRKAYYDDGMDALRFEKSLR